jgi:ATP-binding cassette subfamily B protein
VSRGHTKRDDEYEGKGRFQGGLLGRLLAFAVPHKGLLLSALVLFPLVAAAKLGQPYLLKEAIDGPIHEGEPAGVWPFALGLFGLVLAQAALQFAQNVIMQLAGQRIMQDVRNLLFRKVLSLAPSYFDRTPIGKVMTRLTGDVEALNEFLSSGLVTVAADSILLLGIVGVMLWLDPTLTLVSFVFVLPLVVGVAKLRGIMRQVYRSLRNRSTAMNVFLNESIVGMTIVQAFRREEINREAYGELTDAWFDESTKSLWLGSSLSTAVQFFQTLTLALLLYVTLDGMFGLAVSVGLVVAFVDYIERFYAPIENLSGRFAILQTALASAEKIFTLLDETDVLPETDAPQALEPLGQGLKLENVRLRPRAPRRWPPWPTGSSWRASASPTPPAKRSCTR